MNEGDAGEGGRARNAGGPGDRDTAALRERFERAGQGHVFAFFDEIGAAVRERLARELAEVDLGLVRELAALALRPTTTGTPELAPPEVFPLARDPAQAARAQAARAAGMRALGRGEVGYLLVAGGQASRLGYDGPKGAFPIGPVSGRTLFEVFARRLIAARTRHGAPVSWYVLTSRANDAATRAFFAEQRFFGLDRDDVFFFEQAMLPALDLEGRILMSAKDGLFLAPNGHGGVLSALASSGGLEHARGRGVRSFSYFQVDNPLARPADPLFLGLHALEQAEMSSKVVEKRAPDEKVGVLGRLDGRLSCIEYSDLPAALRQARDPAGRLVYSAGNIALHVIEREFVETLTRGGRLDLPWHVARKSIAAIDRAGRPAKTEGFKFETFVFDALRSTRRSVTLEVDRALEFSPVKNASGEDSPATARADLCRLHAGWAERAGLPLPPRGPDGVVPVEVDPVFAETEEEFRERASAAGGARPEIDAKGHFYR